MTATRPLLSGAPSACTECGSTDISWQAGNTTMSGVQDGRLRLSEVKCQFVLGCNYCSETLAVVSADRMADMLNGLQD